MALRRSRGEGSVFYQATKGLWVARITLPDGRKKSKYAKTQKAVRDWLVAQREALRRGVLPKDDAITVAEYFGRYMSDVAKYNLRPKTLETYEYLLRLHILPGIGRIKLTALAPHHLQALYAQKLESGLSKRTVQFMHSVSTKRCSRPLDGIW